MSHHLNDSTKLEPCDHVDLSGPGKKAICVKAVKRLAKHLGLLRMDCLLYTSPSPRDVEESRMPSSA